MGLVGATLTVLVWSLASGGSASKRHTGSFRVDTHSPASDLHAVVPDEPAEGRGFRMAMLFGEANQETPQYLPGMLASEANQVPLAEEMDTIFLFFAPKPAGTVQSVTNLAKTCWTAFSRSYPVDDERVALVGHAAGAETALAMFTAHGSMGTSLVLVDPKVSEGESETKAASDPRPALIAVQGRPGPTVQAAKGRLLSRCATAEVMVLSAPSLEKLPAAYLGAFLTYAEAAVLLHEEKEAPSRIADQGVSRLRRLQSMVKARDLVARPALGLDAFAPLTHAHVSAVDENGEFIKDLQRKAEALQPLAREVGEKVEKDLAAAKTQGEARLALLRKSRTTGERREALFERFAQENFPWPDLVAKAEAAAAEEAPTAASKGGTPSAKGGATVSETAFVGVMKAKCVRCHKVCATVNQLKQNGWLRPGRPENSLVYTVIGKHKNAGATYHNLSDRDKQTVYDFVKAAK